MSKIIAEFEANAQPMLHAIETVNASVKRLGSAFAGVSIGLAGAGSAGQLVTAAFSQLRATINNGAELANLARTTGQSAGELVTLQRAFKVAGVDAGTLPAALRGVAKALAGINEDGEPTNATLKRLGINVASLRTQGAVEQFRALAVAIMALPSPAERLAAVQKVFGKAGADHMPVLQDLADAPTFDKIVRSAAELAAFVDKNGEGFRQLNRDIAGVEGKWDQFKGSMIRGFISGQSEAGKLTDKTEGFVKTLNGLSVGTIGSAVGARGSLGLDAFLKKSPGALVLRPILSPLFAKGAKEQVAAEADAQAKTLEKMLAGVATEGDRTSVGQKFTQMREPLAAKIKAAGPGEDQAEQIAGWLRQIEAIEKARGILADIPPEILRAKAEQLALQAAIEATAAAAAVARERIATGFADLAGKEKQLALSGMKPAEQRQAILGEMGQGPRFTAADLDRQIGDHEQARNTYNLEPEQEIYYAKLLETKERLLGLNQTIANQEKAAFRELEAEREKAARANLTPAEHRRALLKDAGAPDERGLDGELDRLKARDPKTLDGAGFERLETLLRLKKELLTVDHQLSANAPKLAAYERGFQLEMAELRVKLDPRLTAPKRAAMLRELDADKRRDRYAQEGVGAGEAPELARRHAAERVRTEDALSARQRQIEEARNPAGIGSLQRIGGGGNFNGGGGGNPNAALLNENQRQTRELQNIRSDLARVLREQPAPRTAAGGSVFN